MQFGEGDRGDTFFAMRCGVRLEFWMGNRQPREQNRRRRHPWVKVPVDGGDAD